MCLNKLAAVWLTSAQYKFCYSAILHAAKVYQDGSRQLRQKLMEERARQANSNSGSPVKALKTSREEHVWLHRGISAKEAEVLLTKNTNSQTNDGKFLVREVQSSPPKFQLSVIFDKAIHNFTLQRERGTCRRGRFAAC